MFSEKRILQKIFDTTLVLVFIGGVALVLWRTFVGPELRRFDEPDLKPIEGPATMSLAGVATQLREGSSAKIALVEFSDFECPFCRRVEVESLPAIMREYVETGKVRFAFRHYPLTRIHRLAMPAATFAECARRQERFWLVHAVLFKKGPAPDMDALIRSAPSLGLDTQRLNECIATDAEQAIQRDLLDGQKFGVTSTPTFFVGTLDEDQLNITLLSKMSGMRSAQAFRTVLDQMLREIK